MTISNLKTELLTFYKYWTSLSPIKYIFFSILLGFIMTIPFTFLFEITGITDNHLKSPKLEKFSFVENVFLSVVLAPILETFIGQSIPIKLIKYYIYRNTTVTAIIVSTLLFSFLHITYSFWYCLITLPIAFIFAVTYISFSERKPSGYWMTVFVHAAHNLLAVVVLACEK